MGRRNQPLHEAAVTLIVSSAPVAAFVACLRLRRRLKRSSIPFTAMLRRLPTFRAIATHPRRRRAGVAVNRLEEELRQANGRIEELENAQHRLEEQLQKFRQDVEFRFGERSDAGSLGPDVAEPPATVSRAPAPQAEEVGRIRSRRQPNAPGAPRPLGTTAPSAPLVREPPLPAGRWCASSLRRVRRSSSAKARPPRRRRADRRSSARASRCSTSRASSSTPRCKPFRRANIQRRRSGSRRFSPPIRRIGSAPDAIFYIGETYLQRSRPREAAEQYLKVTTDYSEVVAGAGEHGAARADARVARQLAAGLRDAERIRQALPDRRRPR